MADAGLKRAEHDLGVALRRFRTRIAVLAMVSVGVDLVCAAIALAFEHHGPGGFATYWEALFWTTTQLLTVSSQLSNPHHTVTKLLDVFMELYAVVVISSLAATFSDLLQHRTRRRSARSWQQAS